MPCYHPLPAWKGTRLTEAGRRPVSFRRQEGFSDLPVQLPCGTCLGCRLGRAQEWALRCAHESELHQDNSFVTLTYDDGKVPTDGSLRPRDMVLFLKRARKRFGKFRFFQCGEYGERTERPHHHALLFGLRFRDLELLRVSNGNSLHVSEELNQLWGNGFCTVGQVTYESAGYVARYTLKKLGQAEYGKRVPPYLTMSRRPGIGAGWFDRFRSDVYPEGMVVLDGTLRSPPRYYDERFRRVEKIRRLELGLPALSADEWEVMKCRRRAAAACDVDGTGSRLVVRESIRQHAVNLLLERPI